MLRRYLLLLALVTTIGCNSQSVAPPNSSPSKVKVTAPGVNVDVKDNGKVDVVAPGVNIKVNPK